MSEYTWRIAGQPDFHAIYALIYNSKVRNQWDMAAVRRRVVIPLFLEQLLIFFNKTGKICGFLTIALMNGQSACHQAALGVLPSDWRSGNQLWVVDFLAPFGGGGKMLNKIRGDWCDVTDQPVRYFRLKTKQIKRISLEKIS